MHNVGRRRIVTSLEITTIELYGNKAMFFHSFKHSDSFVRLVKKGVDITNAKLRECPEYGVYIHAKEQLDYISSFIERRNNSQFFMGLRSDLFFEVTATKRASKPAGA